MNIKEYKLKNPGILTTKIPDNIFAQLQRDLGWYQGESYNQFLVGQIAEEREFVVTIDLEMFLNDLAQRYAEHFSLSQLRVSSHKAWANFQKRYEYNPCHLHDSALSWVTWLKIPYRFEDEDQLPNTVHSMHSLNGRFQFFFNRLDGRQETQNLDIDSSWEQTIIMFPGTLRHTVYPFFTSDQVRISLAGNIYASFVDE